MKIIQVTYTVKTDFTEQNKINIQNVMTDLQNANHKGINYNSCLASDNKTFIHTAFFNSDDDQKKLNELASFKSFREQLKASGPEVPPNAETISLVGSSKDIF